MTDQDVGRGLARLAGVLPRGRARAGLIAAVAALAATLIPASPAFATSQNCPNVGSNSIAQDCIKVVGSGLYVKTVTAFAPYVEPGKSLAGGRFHVWTQNHFDGGLYVLLKKQQSTYSTTFTINANLPAGYLCMQYETKQGGTWKRVNDVAGEPICVGLTGAKKRRKPTLTFAAPPAKRDPKPKAKKPAAKKPAAKKPATKNPPANTPAGPGTSAAVAAPARPGSDPVPQTKTLSGDPMSCTVNGMTLSATATVTYNPNGVAGLVQWDSVTLNGANSKGARVGIGASVDLEVKNSKGEWYEYHHWAGAVTPRTFNLGPAVAVGSHLYITGLFSLKDIPAGSRTDDHCSITINS